MKTLQDARCNEVRNVDWRAPLCARKASYTEGERWEKSMFPSTSQITDNLRCLQMQVIKADKGSLLCLLRTDSQTEKEREQSSNTIIF
jgi:hypothetical protein